MLKKRSLLISRPLLILLAAVMLLSAAGCGGYTSRYRAVGFVHSNGPSSADMAFISFEGRMVFKLRSTGRSGLAYSARLDSGSVSVFCEHGGTREPLFSLRGGETVDSALPGLEKGTVYIIAETDGECLNGEIRFSLQ